MASDAPGALPDPADHGRLRRVDLREGSTETVTRQAGTSAWRATARLLFLVVAAVTLYALMPRLVDVWSELPRLRDIGWWWFPVMLGLEVASVACLWQLARLAIPGVSLFQAATGQLVGNAISKCVPGGGPVGAATQMRMFSVSGVELSTAVSALGAAGLVSTWVLFALPAVALLVSLVGSPVPQGMVHVAWGGAAVFVVMFLGGLAITRSDWLLRTVGPGIERTHRWILQRFGREGGITVDRLEAERDEMVRTLGGRFREALLMAVGNWLLDYGVLVAALLAIGSEPRLSLVLLAYAASAVLTMIPITPGGLGFVEAGLTATLVLAGVPSQDALLSTLAYRLFNYWLPLPAGLVAYIAFRRRYGKPPRRPATDRRRAPVAAVADDPEPD